jgi:hypothetical protein
MTKLIILLLLLTVVTSCDRSDRQEIDLSNTVIEIPADGIGHYVYALSLPVVVFPGSDLDVQMEWRTVGPVDPIAHYAMEIIVDGPDQKIYTVRENENTVGEYHLANWLSYYFLIPTDFRSGTYTVGVRLRDQDGSVIPLGFTNDLRMEPAGFYRLGQVLVE